MPTCSEISAPEWLLIITSNALFTPFCESIYPHLNTILTFDMFYNFYFSYATSINYLLTHIHIHTYQNTKNIYLLKNLHRKHSVVCSVGYESSSTLQLILTIWRLNWSRIMTCQPFWGYFMPRASRNVFIERQYLHLCICFLIVFYLHMVLSRRSNF